MIITYDTSQCFILYACLFTAFTKTAFIVHHIMNTLCL